MSAEPGGLQGTVSVERGSNFLVGHRPTKSTVFKTDPVVQFDPSGGLDAATAAAAAAEAHAPRSFPTIETRNGQRAAMRDEFEC
jgi:hypothetical protein